MRKDDAQGRREPRTERMLLARCGMNQPTWSAPLIDDERQTPTYASRKAVRNRPRPRTLPSAAWRRAAGAIALALATAGLGIASPTTAHAAGAAAAGPAAAAPIPVVFDNDMAIDDWTALLYLARHPRVELRAITVTGAGEARCGPAMQQMPRLMDLAALPAALPFACGDAAPLDGRLVFPEPWRKEADTLSGVALPPSARQPDARGAVALLHEVVGGSKQPVVLVATGPLTNIAQWLQRHPADARKIARLVVMGGSLEAPGNIIVPGFTDGHPNRVSEWNLYVDALAAQRVFAMKLPITLVPLDATNQVRVTADFVAAYKQRATTPAGRFVDAVFDRNQAFIASGEYYFWDVLAAIVAIEPQWCQGPRRAVAVAAEPTAQPYLVGEDPALPALRWDGQPRRHLDAATAGRTRFAAQGPRHLVCQKTDRAAVMERFTAVLNRAP